MPLGFPVAFVLLAEAAASTGPSASGSSYGPVAAVSSPAPPSVEVSRPQQEQRQCTPQNQDPKANEIIVCAVKPDGYRLPPDIVEARRLKKEGVTIRPHNPHETFSDHSCANVGPMGCRGTPTVNMLAVAATAAEISKRLAKGQEIGSIFQTEKASSDYQYFLEAKKERETKEAAAAAKAAKARALAERKSESVPAPGSTAPPLASSAVRN